VGFLDMVKNAFDDYRKEQFKLFAVYGVRLTSSHDKHIDNVELGDVAEVIEQHRDRIAFTYDL